MDDVYRAEFPGPYYSTSSVYSYSPTSASDCPEHGRSRKKITVILTTSIVLATLGVLSIAGVAAYLGILSKNINNNASQSVEEYLLSDSSRNNIGGYTTTEESEYIFTTNDDNGGLDALEGVPGDSLIDLSNVLSESSSKSSADHRRTTPVPPRQPPGYTYGEGSKSNQKSGTKTIEGHFGHVTSNVRTTDDLLNHLVTAGPPHFPEENSVRLFTEEASTSSVTKGPQRPNRNRQRYPLTNSHSLGPSTTTMYSNDGGIMEEVTANNNYDDGGDQAKNSDDLGKHDSVIHISHPENAKNPEKKSESLQTTTIPSSTSSAASSNRKDITPGNIITLNKLSESTFSNREGLAVHSATVSTAAVDSSRFKDNLPTSQTISTSSAPLHTNRPSDLGSSSSNSQQKHQSNEPSKPINKLSDKDRAQQTTSVNNNKQENMSVTSMNHQRHEVMQADDVDDEPDNGHRRHDKLNTKNSNGDNVKPLSQEMFKPIHPIISSERDDLLNNHKMPLSFDRVSPEYYDTNPWTPLLDRPNLDKRPRVDVDNGPLSSTEPVIVWNSEEPEESVEFPHANLTVAPGMDVIYGHGGNFTVGTYYGYGHTGQAGSVDDAPWPNSDEPVSYTGFQGHYVNETQQGPPPMQNEEVLNGFKPSKIPSYTILIPHIPNPADGANNTDDTTGITAESSKETDDHVPPQQPHEADYVNTYSKLDRMGVAADAEDVEEKEKKPVNTRPVKVKHDEENITYNFEEIKTLPVPEETNSKDEDYMDEFTEAVQGEPKIYRLDPDSVDVVPDTLGNSKHSYPSSTTTAHTPKTQGTEASNTESDGLTSYDDDSVEQKQNEIKKKKHSAKDPAKEYSPASMELVIGPKEPDLLIKSTTDLIMSTLGSLNLIKHHMKDMTEEEIEEKLRNSDVLTSTSSSSQEANKTTESPLFPPVRSYVGINQPLRPKPDKLDPSNTNKQFRYDNIDSDTRHDSSFPIFPPDVATTASLHKVLSMMLGTDGMLNEKSRHLASHPLIKGLLNKENVTIILTNETGSPTVINLESVLPTVMPTMRQTPTTEKIESTSTLASTTNHREMKSFGNHRDSKIDTAQFTTSGDVEHVPVPLIITEAPMQADEPPKPKPEFPPNLTPFPWSSKPSKVSTKVLNDNSPVYKFVLKKGQSVEDLLKEIFLNYTDINETTNDGAFRDSSQDLNKVPVNLGIFNHGTGPGFKSLEDVNVDESAKDSTAPERINHHVETTPLGINPVPTVPSSQESGEVHTATSIVVNEESEMGFECPGNDSFRCASSGKCIPTYLRCNFIKECEDNSDEEGCLCADFLRANGNARKLCDGIPDCADASDEYQDCEYCRPGQYICAGTRSCINKTQICDSKRDCQYGDDESDCVKIGHDEITSLKENFAPTYHRKGHLVVRKTGNWGKLCVESFSSVVSHWEVKDLARAVCKALTFSDYETVEKVQDPTPNSTEPYYELHYGSNNQSTSSGEAHQRPGLGFRQTECKSKLVVNVTCQDLQCGVAPRAYTQRARIVGGANSLPGKWPWQAALYKNGEYQCGATLISSRWLLSAGHCFYHAQDDHWVARLGTLRRGATVLSPYEQVVRITHVFLHPDYQDVGFINDVSLLRLEKEVNFTDFVRPVCLPGKESKILDGRMCTVVGWGQLFEVGRVFPDTLQEVQLPLISTSECRKRTLFLPLYKLTDQMFCAGFDRGGRDACLGDSGGPLMCPESDGRWSLYGVTSNGYGCARANRPGVYTKVTSYLDWIYDKMSQDSAFTYRDKSKPCPGHRCLLGECLDKRQVCNGIRDCIEDDGSDERGPNCTTYLT